MYIKCSNTNETPYKTKMYLFIPYYIHTIIYTYIYSPKLLIIPYIQVGMYTLIIILNILI